MTHALTTEAEEIMGLLLGDINVRAYGTTITSTSPRRRAPTASRLHAFGLPCRRYAPTGARCVTSTLRTLCIPAPQDRVEASPEQMVRCAAQAEECSKQRGVRIRVIGWYHSHPHITVLPSHVDVRTQATYQQLDEGFIGLIFSTFNEDAATHAQRVQVCQSETPRLAV